MIRARIRTKLKRMNKVKYWHFKDENNCRLHVWCVLFWPYVFQHCLWLSNLEVFTVTETVSRNGRSLPSTASSVTTTVPGGKPMPPQVPILQKYIRYKYFGRWTKSGFWKDGWEFRAAFKISPEECWILDPGMVHKFDHLDRKQLIKRFTDDLINVKY